MRISALSSIVALGTLVALGSPAHAEHKATHAAPRQVTALSSPTPSERDAPTPTLTTGDLAFTRQVEATHLEPFLSARDITSRVSPHAPEIQRCYLQGIAASRHLGHLDLTFVIARDGAILSLHAAAPGVPARTTHKIEDCIRAAVDGLAFPARGNDTTAVVPYLFQKTAARNAGPRPSCRSRKGC
jgi:hypothetical protein